ncbi:MAG TPA: protease complex subunit PrcB family protein [bacterium]|nr:protease complex subunit PrcB family protein [bacterium]
MRDCQKIHPLLSFYAEGELPPDEKNQVEEHLKVCAEARRELEQYRRQRKTLIALPIPEPPRDLHDRIMSRLRGAPQPLPKPHPWLTWTPWALAAAAALVVIFLHPLTPGNKPEVVAQLPKAFEEKTSTNLPQPAAQTSTTGVGQNIGLNTEQTRKRDTSDRLPNQQMAFAKKTKRATKGNEVEPAAGYIAKDQEAEKTKNLEVAMANQPAAALPPAESSNKPMMMNKAVQSAGAPAADLALSAAAPLPQPTEGALRSIGFSKEISASTWSGNNAPVTAEKAELVTDPEVFKQDWQALRPGETPPDVDFTTQAVVYLAAGQQPTPGYSVHVSNLEEKTEQLVIHYKVEGPAAGTTTAQLLTRPWSLQVIPKPSKPVQFQKD